MFAPTSDIHNTASAGSQGRKDQEHNQDHATEKTQKPIEEERISAVLVDEIFDRKPRIGKSTISLLLRDGRGGTELASPYNERPMYGQYKG